MSLFVLVNDIHAADRPPSSCTEAYTEDLLSLLRQAIRIARERHAAAVVLAGDVFHFKAPSRTSHKLVLRLVDILQAAACPVYIVPGNHDLQHDRLESIDVTQPLGVLLRSGASMLHGWAVTCGSPSYELPIYGVPWLQGYGNYAEDGEDIDFRVGKAMEGYRDREMDGDPTLVVTHAPLYPPGQELPYEYFPAERWAEAMGGRGYVWYGHVHEDHGAYQVSPSDHEEGSVTFANFGALSRGSLHEYNLTRQVAIGIWDSGTGQFERVNLDAKPAEEVFRLREKAEVTDMQGRLDEFLAGIGGTTLDIMTTESVIAHARTMGLGREAEALIEELLA